VAYNDMPAKILEFASILCMELFSRHQLQNDDDVKHLIIWLVHLIFVEVILNMEQKLKLDAMRIRQ